MSEILGFKIEDSGEEVKHVKVRIAVAVDPEGNWNATGYNLGDIEGPQPAVYIDHDKFVMSLAIEPIGEGEARYWIEALLPVPSPVVILGNDVKVTVAE